MSCIVQFTTSKRFFNLQFLLRVDHKSLEKQIGLPLISRPKGRPTTLSNEEQSALFADINAYISRDIKPTLYDIEQLVIDKFQKSISIDNLRNYIMNSGI